MKLKRIISVLAAAALCIGSVAVPNSFDIFSNPSIAVNAANSEQSEINVDYRTQDEIREYVKNHPFDFNALTIFDEEPSIKAPYSLGKVSDESMQDGLNYLNIMRYIAGLDEVGISSDYIPHMQAAAVVNAANDQLSHYPVQPADMDDDMYKLGKEGAGRANLHMYYFVGYGSSDGIHRGYDAMSCSVAGYMDDSDDYNIPMVGHRRWCLNPFMKYTAFGKAGTYFSMYSFDCSGESDKKGVSWPAENMPVQYFKQNQAWSISMGYSVNKSAVKVTLTRKSDSKKWTFSSSSSDGDFYVNNQYYAQPGCIIFRPSDIDGYNDGDKFTVSIEGLNEPLTYNINFFDLTEKSVEETTAPEETTTSYESTTIVTEETEIPEISSEESTENTEIAEDDPLSADAVYKKLMEMQAEYPEGMPWTNDNFYEWKGGIYYGGFGCAGFAFALSDNAFGNLPARTHTDFSDIKVGDIVRMNNDSHSVIVLEVNGSVIKVAEGNYNSSVHWGRIIDLSKENSDSLTYVMTRYPEISPEETTTVTEETTILPETTTTPEEIEIFPETTTADDEITMGDIDGDGEISSSDALKILQYVVGITELTDKEKIFADVDGDSEITSSDALMILQYVVGLIEKF